MAESIRIKKEDLGFFAAQAAFMIFAVIRFYDRSFVPMRNMHFDRLLDKKTACMGCAVYFFVILLFSLVSLAHAREEKKKQVAFLLTAMSVVFVPAFLPENYLGVIDMYSAILGFLALMLLHCKYADRFAGILIFLMIRWDITSAFTWGIWLLAYTFYLTYRDRESVSEEPSGGKKIALAFATAMFVAGCAIPRGGNTSWDRAFEPRYELTSTQGIITLIFLIPFAVLYLRLLYHLASEMRRFMPRLSYYCLFFAALLGFTVWYLKGDLYRAILYLAGESILGMLVLVQGERLRGYELPASHKSIWDSSRWVRVFLLLYLVFVMFFFVYGRPLLLEEQLLKY
ncbi:MAG: hypothetical protein K6B14_01940 [Lachnospiraceae bacterium]|nr:hypothetical protein [Lachnospiraceae bacterium]